MFFHKKDKGVVPPEEVEKMIASGMSDKDIIKHLKAKGYSYETIEKAMLQAVKQGVSETPFAAAPRFAGAPQPQPPEEDFSLPTGSEFGMDTLAEQPLFEAEAPEEDFAIEELIEGIVEDKWHKFEDATKGMEERMERLRAEIQSLEGKIKSAGPEAPSREMDAKLNEFSERADELDARVGGLEKAFKQFLPALTRNIESLSEMIHDMKAKGIAQAEEA